MSTAVVQPTVNAFGVAAFQDRWGGWPPCDYANFLKSKELYKLTLRDYSATRRRDLWRTKLPHNRVRKYEPPIEGQRALGTDRASYLRILTAYRAARKPAPAPDSVSLPDLPADWWGREGLGRPRRVSSCGSPLTRYRPGYPSWRGRFCDPGVIVDIPAAEPRSRKGGHDK